MDENVVVPLTPLTSTEIALISRELQALVGGQLQEVLQTETAFGLGFYQNGAVGWLWVDLSPNRPMIVRMARPPKSQKKLTRPLTLFVRSRFLGRRLAEVRQPGEFERILIFSFHRGKDEQEALPCEIELRLLPHGQNVIARDGDRSIAELKPKELPPAARPSETLQPREWARLEEAWCAESAPAPQMHANQPAAGTQSAAEREWKKQITKKEKILERLQEEIREKSHSRHRELGEWLKTYGSLEAPRESLREGWLKEWPTEWPAEWRELIDREKSLSWNIENCFHRAKENLRKLQGTQQRFTEVMSELEKLRASGAASGTHGGQRASQEDRPRGESLLEKSEAKGRKFQVADDLEAYVGKSAADNLRLLRKAQPFDYWMHLRERPGSHAILRRTRGRVVSDAEFLKVGVWVAEQSLKKRANELKGERYDLLIVECRYVRPIKGDKLGRVHYTHDRVLTMRF